MRPLDNIMVGLAQTSGLGDARTVNIFDHRVTSRPATATVYVEQPTKDPLAVRLAESLQRATEQRRLATVEAAQ